MRRKATAQRARRREAKRRRELLGKQQARTLTAMRTLLADFARCGHLQGSADAAGVCRQQVHRWVKQDAKSKALYDEALEEAVERLEEEARRRAVDGVVEPIVSAGKSAVSARYSDTLLIFFLKGKRPDTFRERQELTGKDGKPLVADVNSVTDDELKAASH